MGRVTVVTPNSAWKAAEAFRLPSAVLGIEAHGDGLIHDTYVVRVGSPAGARRFILQRINQQVFGDPVALMSNIECVADYIADKAAQASRGSEHLIPRIVQTDAGHALLQTEGEAWRMFQYVEGALAVRGPVGTSQAYQIASTFGRFLNVLLDFPLSLLQDALPGYRDTRLYLAKLWQTLDQDLLNRASDVGPEMAFVQARVEQALRLQQLQQGGSLPIRVIHGDTKWNNVLLDIETGQGACVIDLDTVMPGLLLHDIGDCLREALVDAPDDRIAFSQLELRMVAAITSGFASSQSLPLTNVERASIADAVSSITLELGLRFLCDYLAGDVYFRTSYAQHNLHRAQQHFRLQRRIEEDGRNLQLAAQQCLGKA